MKPRAPKATEKEVRAEIHMTRAPRMKEKAQHARLKADTKKKGRRVARGTSA